MFVSLFQDKITVNVYLLCLITHYIVFWLEYYVCECFIIILYKLYDFLIPWYYNKAIKNKL